MISDKKNVFKAPLDFSKCRKSIPTIFNGADHVIGRCGALSCMCDFFLSYTQTLIADTMPNLSLHFWPVKPLPDEL